MDAEGAEIGLRERKKRETRRNLARVAVALFAERGFDAVTVADVARAADVSTKTVFNYFPTKEDLMLDGREAFADELIQRVRERPAGESVLAAVRAHTLATATQIRALPAERRAEFRQVMRDAPTVQARFRQMLSRHDQALARVLAEEGGAGTDDLVPVVAAELLGVLAHLAFCDLTGAVSGADVTDAIGRAFDLLETGMGSYGVRG